MTVKNPAVFLQAGSHPAEDVRRAFDVFLGVGSEGYVETGDLLVAESGTPDMGVQIAGGRALIQGTESTYSGVYMVENRGVETAVITAADVSNPRIDIVCATVEDSAYSGATDAWSISVTAGTPAGSPSAPSLPSNSLLLCTVAVAAGATSILDANLTDGRVQWNDATRPGGVDVAVADGGTGSSTASAARTALGAADATTVLNLGNDVSSNWGRLNGIDTVQAAQNTDIATNTTKLAGIEAGADVTDSANVSSSGAFMASGVSAFGATVVDDADAAAVRTTIGAAADTITDAGSYVDATDVDAAFQEVFSGQYGRNVVAATGATETLTLHPAQHVIMNQNCTFTFASPTAQGHTFLLRLSGAFTPTFPASVEWADAAAPVYAGKALFVFTTFDGGTAWLGNYVGGGFA
mgnify:CR=1 FL=1